MTCVCVYMTEGEIKKLHFPWVFAVTWAKEVKPMKKG